LPPEFYLGGPGLEQLEGRPKKALGSSLPARERHCRENFLRKEDQENDMESGEIDEGQESETGSEQTEEHEESGTEGGETNEDDLVSRMNYLKVSKITAGIILFGDRMKSSLTANINSSTIL